MKHLSWGLQALVFGCLLAAQSVASPLRAEDETPVTRLFDTHETLDRPLTPEEVAMPGWHRVPEDQTNVTFAGDAVMLNDKLAVVFRQQAKGPEVYAKTASGFKLRAVLSHAPNLDWAIDQDPVPVGMPGKRIVTVKIVENTAGGVEVECQGPTASLLRFRLTAGEAILEIRSPDGAGFVEWRSDSKYLVIPDFFGDDMVYGAEAFQGCCLPTENFCLRLIEGGDAAVMGVWRSRDQEAWLARTNRYGTPPVSSPATEAWLARINPYGALGKFRTAIRCVKDQSLWLAFLESPGLWRALSEPAKATTPFPAKWRFSYLRQRNESDSWDLERGPSEEQSAGPHVGPALIYPIDRSPATPLTATCPTDVMRNTLGVGPCQYILACEGMGAQGDPTPNSVMTWVEKQFEQKKDKKAADDIKERLQGMTKHVAEARARIQSYSDFAGRILGRSGIRPAGTGIEPVTNRPAFGIGLASSPVVQDLDRFATAGLGPDSTPEAARELAAQVIALIGRDDSLPACRQAGERLRALGATQDRALAKCRMAVRQIKAQSLTLASSYRADVNPLVQKEISNLAETMLKAQ